MAYRTIYSRVLSIWENVMSKDALSEAKHIKQVSDAQISIASLLVYANYIALFFNFISSTHTNKNIIVRQAWELHKTGSICTILSALCGSDSNFRRKSMLWRNLSGRSKSAKSRIQLLLLKLTFFMCSRWSQWFACFFFYRTQLPRSFTVFFQEGFSCDEKKSSAKRPIRVSSFVSIVEIGRLVFRQYPARRIQQSRYFVSFVECSYTTDIKAAMEGKSEFAKRFAGPTGRLWLPYKSRPKG